MIHARVDLVMAMRGDADARSAFELSDGEWNARASAACLPSQMLGAWAFVGNPPGGRAEEDPHTVDCPTCLRLMRLATDPVRYDLLRERGLVPELPLVSG